MMIKQYMIALIYASMALNAFAFLQIDLDNVSQQDVRIQYCIQHENQGCSTQAIRIPAGTTYRINLNTHKDSKPAQLLLTKAMASNGITEATNMMHLTNTCPLNLNFPDLLAKHVDIKIGDKDIICHPVEKGVAKGKTLQPISRPYQKIYPPEWGIAE